jgi:hypothetical protein
MKYLTYLIITFSIISCKSKNEKKADKLIENINNLKIEFTNNKNITRGLIDTYYADIKTINDSLKVISRDKKIKKIKNNIDEKITTIKNVLDSIVGVYSINLIKGDYQGQGKKLILIKDYGYMDFVLITTQINIISKDKINLKAEDSFHEIDLLDLTLVNINNKGDSLITGECKNKEDGKIYCTFNWRKNNIILSRTYQTNATGQWQTLTWESNNIIKNLNEISKENVINKSEDDQEIFTINDPDGYTNVREEKNSTSKILFKINEGEEFKVLSKKGDWWEIDFNGKTGFIHKSRIISVEN